VVLLRSFRANAQKAGRLDARVGIGQPDPIIILEALENAPQRDRPVGCADHERMDSDDDRCLSRGVGAGLAGQLQHVIQAPSRWAPSSVPLLAGCGVRQITAA
jgi:hypothetical protein